MLLESAKDERLHFRLEVADLQKDATESMANICTKWKRHQGLSRAEWMFLAQYVQIGCEETSENPDLPLRESYTVLLGATFAVRSLRTDRGIELDRYYLGNLMPYHDAALNERRLDPDVVPQTVQGLIHGLRTAPSTSKPTFAGRNFYEALRDETLPNMIALSEKLTPYIPVLFRLGARGHWIREHRPVRARRERLRRNRVTAHPRRCSARHTAFFASNWARDSSGVKPSPRSNSASPRSIFSLIAPLFS